MTADIEENTLVKIEWVDTFTPRGRAWWDRNEIAEIVLAEPLIESVGRVAWADETWVALFGGMWGEDSLVSELTYIPQGTIQRVTVLNLDGEVVYDRQEEE